jgi:hypothetical protein
MFFDCADLWGDFEENLACLSRDKVMQQVDLSLELTMDTFDEDDENFSYADYYASIDQGTDIINAITIDLKKYFVQWIKTLQPEKHTIQMISDLLCNNALFINFNYTEFLETIYGISKNRILNIHGNRQDVKSELVLGHGKLPEQTFEEWYNLHKNDKRFKDFCYRRNGKRYRNDDLTYLAYFLQDETKGNWRNPIRYYAAQNAAEKIEEYYKETSKKTDKIIRKNACFFDSLDTIDTVIVLGHSLSAVDLPYFKKIIEINKEPGKLKWKISWYSEADKKRIEHFIDTMKLNSKNLELLKLT